MPMPYNKQLITDNPLADPEHPSTTSGLAKEAATGEASPTVRFASVNEEIEPAKTLEDSSRPSGADEATLKELSKTLQNTQLQGRRMSHFAFEPVSLPASRVRLLSCSTAYLHLGTSNLPMRQAAAGSEFMMYAEMEHITLGAKFRHPRISLGCRCHSLYASRSFNAYPPPRTNREALRDPPHLLALTCSCFLEKFFVLLQSRPS
jgi:hypothetical protein